LMFRFGPFAVGNLFFIRVSNSTVVFEEPWRRRKNGERRNCIWSEKNPFFQL
jgi:hypothetical protein